MNIPRFTFDLETHLIEPGNIIPKPVAGSAMIYDGKALTGPHLLYMTDVKKWLEYAFKAGWLVVGHNVFYDLACTWRMFPEIGPMIWDLLAQGRVSDTVIREKLIKCAEGRLDFDWKWNRQVPKFTLDSLAKEYLNIDISEDKHSPDSWRLRYKELDGVPFEKWPEAAKTYMLNDSRITDAIWLRQCPDRATSDGIPFINNGRVVNEIEQCQAAWALLLITAWGLITDPQSVNDLELSLVTEIQTNIQELKQAGVLKPDGSRLLKRIRELVQQAFHEKRLTVPMTAGGATRGPEIKTDGDTLKESGNPLLLKLEHHNELAKLLDTFVRPVLKQGTHNSVHPNYDVVKATGRTSSYGTGRGADKEGCNIQQLPRKGGVRECFIPRPGYLFIDCDYSTIELAALAQVTYRMFGYSIMRDMLIKGYDLHLVMAANLVGLTYEETLRRFNADDENIIEMRQLAKVPNFGFPGGMGPEKLILFAKSTYDMDLTLEETTRLRDVWRQTFPEMNNYFNWFSNKSNASATGEFTLIQPMSGRVRGRVHYTSGANSNFQGLAGDGAKRGLFLISRECYVEPKSPLYGTRMVAFVHDQVLAETPAAGAPEAAERLSALMVAGMKEYLPDVPVVAEPKIMRKWFKKAKCVRDANGRLKVWESTEK
jgi:DNA polymerase I